MDNEAFVDSIRKDFPVLGNLRNRKPPVYLDNACTTLIPLRVLEAINAYYLEYAACGGARSRHWFAREVSDRVEGDSERGIKGSRSLIKEFINARSSKEIIFTSNTSHALNTVALGLPFNPGDVVLLTDKEHNSNLTPWLRLQDKGLIEVDIVNPAEDDTFDLELYEKKLETGKVKLVSVAYTSNITGYTIPAKEIIRMAHDRGIKVMLDAAQAVPHRVVDVQDLDVDFLAFSLHKMCGPRGVGVLYARQEVMAQGKCSRDNAEFLLQPCMLGGGTVADSTYSEYELLDPPERFELGIQDYAGQIAAGEAVRYIQTVGMERIASVEKQLNNYLTEQLLSRYGDTGWFTILGPQRGEQRDGILTFEVRRPNAIDISDEMDTRNNIMIRDSVFCVHAYLNKLYGKGWAQPRMPHEHRMTYRVSFYFYNTLQECDIFLDTLHDIFEERGYV